MADSSHVDDILEFLRRNKFAKAEAALRNELGHFSDLNGLFQKLKLDDKESSNRSITETNGTKLLEEDRKIRSSQHSGKQLKDSSSAEAAKELIVKEIECGTGRNGPESKLKGSGGATAEQGMVNASVGKSDINFTFSKSLDDAVLDLYSSKYSSGNGAVPSYQNDGSQVSRKARLDSAKALDSGEVNSKSAEDISFPGEKPVRSSEAIEEPNHGKSELKEVDQQRKPSGMYSNNDFAEKHLSRSNISMGPPSELWKDSSPKTVFPFSEEDTSTSCDNVAATIDKKEGKRKIELSDIKAEMKDQVDELGRALYIRKTEGGEPKYLNALELLHLAPDNQKEELPRLPPVRLKSEHKPFNIHWEEKYERDGPGPNILNADNGYLIGSFLDVPIGRETNTSGFLLKILYLTHNSRFCTNDVTVC